MLATRHRKLPACQARTMDRTDRATASARFTQVFHRLKLVAEAACWRKVLRHRRDVARRVRARGGRARAMPDR